MKTVYLKSDSKKDIQKAAEIIKKGGLVAFPTETVYGLGGDALNKKSAEKIYRAKGRPSDNPLIIHIAEPSDLEKIAKNISEKAYEYAQIYWPGPLTMIFEKKDCVPYETTGGLDTVAVRLPAHDVACALIKSSGGFIAAPSANRSGRPSPTSYQHVADDLDGRIDAVVCGDDCVIGLESTILDMTKDTPLILRPGKLRFTGSESAVYEQNEHAKNSTRPKAPGMKYTHYAPKGEMYIVKGDAQEFYEHVKQLMRSDKKMPRRVGVIANNEFTDTDVCGAFVEYLGDENSFDELAHNLYSVLRKMDDFNADIIYAMDFSKSDNGEAIMDRLHKAAGYKVIR